MRRWLWFVVLAAVTACGSSDDDGPDASSEAACFTYLEFAQDAEAGLVQPSEVRGRLQEVWEDARYSENQVVRNNTERLLAAATGDGPATGAADQLAAACSGILGD